MFRTGLESLHELFICKRKQLRRLNVHLLSLENIDQFHLFLERCEQFVPMTIRVDIHVHGPVKELLRKVFFGETRNRPADHDYAHDRSR